ncbi:MAG: TIGR04086 family membrane protein [Defluviitaleaceae bacterium]|nr:TIGR04086 family membrane protein [Defluviitaleaceae bacterium]
MRIGIKSLFSGVLIGYAITITVFIGYAILLTHTNLSENNISLVVSITSVVSVLVAGFDSARYQQKKGWAWGVASGFLYGLLLILLMMIFQGGTISSGRSFSLLILSLAGGGLGGVLGINFKKE